MGIFLRWLFAFILVTATFNPTEWNYTRWAMKNYATETPITVLAGLILLISYVIFIRATMRSIGWLGITLITAVVALADLGAD